MTLLLTSSLSAWTFGNSQRSTTSIHPVPVDLRAIENGGPLFAIEAASDGVGALIVDSGIAGDSNIVDNGAFNDVVYSFGLDAMENNVLLNDQISFGLNPVTDSQRSASNDITWSITTNNVNAVFR